MKCNNRSFYFAEFAYIAITIALAAFPAAAQTEQVLYSFDGTLQQPVIGVIFGINGDLYGTAFGGATGSAVFQLAKSEGTWTESTIYGLPNGDYETSVCFLVADAAGNLYGSTQFDGATNAGAIFELSPTVGGGWAYKTLHTFSFTGKDGNTPVGGMVLDGAGNLYGATFYGGGGGCSYDNGCGTIFELSPSAGGVWSEKILHAFNIGNQDGNYPMAGLVLDASGNLFGTTEMGGTNEYGTVFELMTEAGGMWKEKILHRFTGGTTDGYFPDSGLTFDGHGDLYGTTSWGGTFYTITNPGGTAFQLTPSVNGGWTEKVIHSFGNSQTGNGDPSPLDTLLLDALGNLYGVTVNGGAYRRGTVFELSPSSGGQFVEEILYSFENGNGDGSGPSGALVFDTAGNLYGTTGSGGANGYGTVFEIVP